MLVLFFIINLVTVVVVLTHHGVRAHGESVGLWAEITPVALLGHLHFETVMARRIHMTSRNVIIIWLVEQDSGCFLLHAQTLIHHKLRLIHEHNVMLRGLRLLLLW